MHTLSLCGAPAALPFSTCISDFNKDTTPAPFCQALLPHPVPFPAALFCLSTPCSFPLPAAPFSPAQMAKAALPPSYLFPAALFCLSTPFFCLPLLSPLPKRQKRPPLLPLPRHTFLPFHPFLLPAASFSPAKTAKAAPPSLASSPPHFSAFPLLSFACRFFLPCQNGKSGFFALLPLPLRTFAVSPLARFLWLAPPLPCQNGKSVRRKTSAARFRKNYFLKRMNVRPHLPPPRACPFFSRGGNGASALVPLLPPTARP